MRFLDELASGPSIVKNELYYSNAVVTLSCPDHLGALNNLFESMSEPVVTHTLSLVGYADTAGKKDALTIAQANESKIQGVLISSPPIE